MDGEQTFIDGEFTDMRGNRGIINELPNKGSMVEDCCVTGGECQMEMASQP